MDLCGCLRVPAGGESGKGVRRGVGVERSLVKVMEKGGRVWEVKVGELPPNVQEVFVRGGLEGWVKGRLDEGK